MKRLSGFFVIVGLGKTGLSSARYLFHQGVDFAVTDSREKPPCLELFQQEFPGVPLALGGFDEALMLKADELVVSQGVSLRQPSIVKCREKGITLTGDLDIFARAGLKNTVVITGSNGKSTVTSLVGEMAKRAGLRVAVGGNLGVPVLDLLGYDNIDLYVIEASNFQLEVTYHLNANVATILNLSPDHLDRYASYQAYIAAKHRIYEGCHIAILNRDDALTFPQDDAPSETVTFGASVPEAHQFGIREKADGTYLSLGDECLMNVSEMAMPGSHSWQNGLAALAIGNALDIPLSVMLAVLKDYRGLRHRCEWVAEHKGVSWYNDSKGTNVGATLAAIQGLGRTISGDILLIAGGLAKGGDFTPLVSAVKDYVKTLILFGQDASKLEAVLASATSDLVRVDSLEEAILTAKTKARSGDLVLLSPACASFDMFDSFEHRGDTFCATVKEILNESAL